MKAYQKERLENVICYFAREHFKKTKWYPSQTILYKYLAFFEFRVLESIGEAPLDLEYLAMKRGPVPIEIYRDRDKLKSELFCFENVGANKYVVKALKKANLDYFSEYEREMMSDLIDIFAQRYTSAQIMSDSSHEQIRAWRKAFYGRGENSPIDKADTFEDLDFKLDEELTPQEEHFLISQVLKQTGN